MSVKDNIIEIKPLKIDINDIFDKKIELSPLLEFNLLQRIIQEFINRQNETNEKIKSLETKINYIKNMSTITPVTTFNTKGKNAIFDTIPDDISEDNDLSESQNLNKKKTPQQSFEEMSQSRTEKIEMYKYKKNLSEKIKKIEKEDIDKIDENREYWVSYLNLCIVKMFESIPMINMEIDAINHMEKMKKNPQEQPQNPKPSEHKKIETLTIKSPEDLLNLDPNNKLVKNLNFVTSFEPNKFQFFNMGNGIQTLDEQILAQLPENIRERVFRNRNPTEMTVEEFGELQKKRMEEEEKKHKEHEKNKSDSDSDKEEVDDKKKKKAREWDDWKDDHPKGSGNRNGW